MKAHTLKQSSVRKIEIVKVTEGERFPYTDAVSVEEPLEIRFSYEDQATTITKNISVTMRTPGDDAELALGFLFTEGILSDPQQIRSVDHARAVCSRNAENVIIVELAAGFVPQLMHADRNFYTTSSCGVCGKGSIASIRTVSAFQKLDQKPQAFASKRFISSLKNYKLSKAISVLPAASTRRDFLILMEICWPCGKMSEGTMPWINSSEMLSLPGNYRLGIGFWY
nr:formate dehydrogenase accessory sulfurtransferase FdhD [Siphonobacter sp. BAB-5385]